MIPDSIAAWRTLDTADEVCSAAEVARAVQRVAREIETQYRDRYPLLLAVMRGGVVFAGHLLPLLPFPLDFDYVDAARYGPAIRGGELQWRVEPTAAVRGRPVLLVDDILDAGHTLAEIRRRVLAAGAASVQIAVFSEKVLDTVKPVKADFVGVTLPDRYVFGFGMDCRGAWRNLPAVYALNEGADPAS